MRQRRRRRRPLMIFAVVVVPEEHHQAPLDVRDHLTFDSRAREGEPGARRGVYFPRRSRRVARL